MNLCIIALMKIFRNKKREDSVVAVLITCFISFVILSWWLLFRDERALAAIESFYPFFEGRFFGVRELLLNYGLNLLPTIAFAFTALVAFVAYFLSLKINFSLRKSVALALIFHAIVFLSFPVLSTDIFSYIASHRVYSEYGQNIWTTAPDNFPEDPFGQLADWKEHPSVYGAANQLIYLPAARLVKLGGDDLLLAVLLYKAVATIFAAGTLAVVLKIISIYPKMDQAVLVRTIFWNPLVILEFLGSGHNDILMFFFLALGILSWQRKWWARAGIFLALAVQVKLIPIFVVVFLGLKLLQDKKFPEIAKFAGSFLLINTLALIYMNINLFDFLGRVAFNTTVYWQSMPSLFERFLPTFKFPFSLIFLLVLAALALLQIRKKWPPLKTATIALLLYVSLFTAAYWNWYILWPFMLAIFTKDWQLKKIILLTTMTSLMAYPVLWLSHRFGFGNPVWSIATYLMIFAIPPIIVFFNKIEKLRQTPLLGDKSRLYYGTLLKGS